MCVAAVIFSPISAEYLKCMEDDNPHGAGIAWEQDGAIQFVKGLTAAEIHEMQESGVMSYPYLLHFRWATHGDKVAALTHPFPIGPRALLGETAGSADKILIHNGTWHWYDDFATKHVAKGNYEFPEELISSVSDTAIAAWLAFYDDSILDSVPWATAVAEMRETIDAEGQSTRTMDITTRGQWYDKDGNWYSNLQWVPLYSSYSGGTPGEYYREYLQNRSYACDGGEYNFYETPVSAAEQRQADDLRAWSRRNDKKWVGLKSDIQVSEEYYKMWFPEKDNHRPEACDWADWYDRFDWAAMSCKGPEQAEKKIEEIRDGRGLTWDEYQTKFGKNSAYSKDISSRDATSGLSWNEYLTAKYGPAVAAEINRCFDNEGGEDGEADEGCGEGEKEADYALHGWHRDPTDPDWLHDGDLITDNPSMVNAWLARQMVAA